MKKAFTLAEVLITLGIIGVVAAMTIPTLITNYNQRAWDTASTVFNRKLGEALKVMNSQSSLAGFTTTKDFVDELSKHIKIIKTCDSNELTNCFVNEIFTTNDPINTSNLKTAKNLNFAEDYGTETIGVQFADGVTALIAYNPNATQDPYSNQVVRVTGSGNSVGLGTDAIAILYDVSGNKSPNEMETGKDIRGINIAIQTGANIKIIGASVQPVDCSNPASEGFEYCNTEDQEVSELIHDRNYWVGAKYACAQQGMHLPSIEELRELYARKGQDGIPTTGWYRSSTQSDDPMYAVNMYFDNGDELDNSKDNDTGFFNILCVGN